MVCKYVLAILKRHFDQVLCKKSAYLSATGENPICMVAHLDTLADYHDGFVIAQEGDWIRNTDGILGADVHKKLLELLERLP
jgi:hypothetical protein